MEAARIQNKVKLLFGKIAEPNYVMNSYYTDSFINKLSDNSDPDASSLVSSQLLPGLLCDALKDGTSYHTTVNVFLGRILAIVCKHEHHFCRILQQRQNKLLEFFSDITSKSMSASLKVAYLELSLALLSHRTGLYWLLETELWKKILRLYDKSTTVFVLRLMYKFAADFLWKLNDFSDENNISAAISFILQPVGEIDYSCDLTLTNDQFEEWTGIYEPVLNMLYSVLTQGDRICYENKLTHCLLKEHNVTTLLYISFERIRRQDLLLLLSKVTFCASLLKSFQAKPNGPNVEYHIDDFKELHVVYFNTINFQIQRRSATLVLDYCGSCNTIWWLVCGKLNLSPTVATNGKYMEPHVKVLTIYLVPILVYVMSVPKGRRVTETEINEYKLNFLNMSCEHTARAAYALRDLIQELDIMSVTMQCVKRLTCIKDHLTDAQANIVFQALFFALREYDPVEKCSDGMEEEEDLHDAEQNMLVMTYIVDTVLAIVKNYNINWRYSLEVICLNTVIHNIITKKQNLSCKFIVTALNLLTVTVSKFLPPNLSLLMESQPGSAMHEIGTLIFTKMHDVRWEVRDSALELLNVCAEISYIKFPPLQNQIIEKNLINVAVTMAFNDHEPYVQVSALRCVAAASRVARMWDLMKAEHPTLMEQLIGMLRHNQEGMVRKEVCNVLCEVYQTIKFSATFKQVLYDHMASSAMCDFHWEVQMSALKFWRIIIQSFLTDQGMLDGTFPPVTFSRETRKIVTLNETEIRKRLIKLLEELSSIGCLTVLLKLLHDDTEVEVMEAAFSVAQELHTILQKYKVQEFVKRVDGEPETIEELICHIEEAVEESNGPSMEAESSTKSENIIEGILKSDDMNLLASIYQKGMNLTNEAPLAPKLKLLKTASPYLFVNFMENTDCRKIIDSKRNWREGIRSISSLLDDVLGLYETNEEFNSLDCY